MNYRYGDTKPVQSPAVASATVIEIGDMVNGVPAPASATVWTTDLPTTQELFHDVFLGVACQRSRNGDTEPIRVATAGVFEFDCASATFTLGQLVGAAKQVGNAIERNRVVAVANAALAIGRVVRAGTNVTKVLVAIDSTLVNGGPQTMM